MNLTNLAFPFHNYNTTGGYVYYTERKGDNYHISINLPGVNKEEIELSYGSDRLYGEKFNIKVPNKNIDRDIFLDHPVDPDKADITLDLGVLNITAPLIDTMRKLAIK